MDNYAKSSNAPQAHCYTAVLRPDPPDSTMSEEGAKTLRYIADQLGQIPGFEELERDERDYQIEVHFRRDE